MLVTPEPQRVRLVRKVETQRAQCFSFEHSAYAYDHEPKTVSHPPASSLKKQARRAFHASDRVRSRLNKETYGRAAMRNRFPPGFLFGGK